MLSNLTTLDSSTSFDTRSSFNCALEFCEKKLKEAKTRVTWLLRKGDKAAHSNFRYGLAKEIGIYLGNLSNCLLEVYVHGSAVKNKSGPGSDLDMIIMTEYKLEPLKFLLFKLNDEIEHFYNEFMEGDYFTGGFSSFLDIKLVDRSELEARKSFGAVISSVNSSPIKIWQAQGRGKRVGQ